MRTTHQHPDIENIIDADGLQALKDRVALEVNEGLLPSAQFAVAFEGKMLAYETFGNASNSTLYPIFSATKAITASLAWQAIEAGSLDLAQSVGHFIPAFTTGGKEAVRIEHLLTHTAGFPNAPFRPTDYWDQNKRQARFQQWRLDWPPGSQYVYHPTSSLWVLVDILERIYQERFQTMIANNIANPLNLPELFIGCPESQHHRIAELKHVGTAPTTADYRKRNLPPPPVTEVTEEAITGFNDTDTRLVPTPGGGGFMNAATLALFYQGLLGYGATTSNFEGLPWQAETVRLARTVRTHDLKDPQLGIATLRGLGIVIAGENDRQLRGFGHTNHPLSFGHNGAGGQIAWADPDSGLSFVYLTNGHDRDPFRQGRRGISLSNRAAKLLNRDTA